MRSLLALGLTSTLLLATTGCPAPQPAVDPVPGSSSTATPGPDGGKAGPAGPKTDPWAIAGELAREEIPARPPSLPLVKTALPALPKGLPKPPASCDPLVKAQPKPAACTDRPATLAALDDALGQTDSALRDLALAALEACPELPAGMVRALRADLGPVECADALVRPVLDGKVDGMDGAVHDTLAALGLAGMLSRAVKGPPTIPPPHTKEAVLALHNGPFKAWTNEQAAAIQSLAEAGSKLRYYARAIAAVEAGMADLRFIDAVRELPIPDEFKKDADLEASYLGGLEQALDQRKVRGRDAALVGLGALAAIGYIADARVTRTRDMLSRMYGGRPVDALDALRLPPLPAAPANGSLEGRLAGKLPTFYAELLLAPESASDAGILRTLLSRGIAPRARTALAGASLDPTARLLYAAGRLRLGLNYWRAVDVDEAVRLLAEWPTGTTRVEEANLLLAVGLALRGGPRNAGDMMLRAPLDELGIGRVEALDALAAAGGPYAGLAAFDAAIVRQVAAPAQADAGYWKELAARYRAAAGRLTDPADQREASERAREAEATSEAIAKRPKDG
ncbi:MAG: hypothetical protein HY908_33530 [Myxococcales bacterium]|nr:hypothetical protein [Myxococcales bacterium]